jgi:hypothetical protein
MDGILNLFYISKEFLRNNILHLFSYLNASNLSTPLPGVTKLLTFILTIPTTSAAVKQSFYFLKNIYAYLCSMQPKETFTKLSLISSKNILQGLENISKTVIL